MFQCLRAPAPPVEGFDEYVPHERRRLPEIILPEIRKMVYDGAAGAEGAEMHVGGLKAHGVQQPFFILRAGLRQPARGGGNPAPSV